MRFPLEFVASLATIAGAVASVAALLQDRGWLLVTGLLFVGTSIVAVWYARKKQVALDAASIVIEGHNIDSLNIASLRRRVDHSFVVQKAIQTARIEGENLEVTWKYSGYCKEDGVATFDFSVDADDNSSFDQLNCVAYDLSHDWVMAHEIRPFLIGADGISKKIAVPFLEPLTANQPFDLLLRFRLPGSDCRRPSR